MNHRAALMLVSACALALAPDIAETPPALCVDVEGEGCPETAPPSAHTGTVLQQFADQTDAGVVYNDALASLQLQKAGGLFKSTLFPVSDNFNVAASGDFDNDGWSDLVVGSSGNKFIRFYKNRTYENAEPDWTDPDDIREPKFVRTVDIEGAGGVGGDAGMVSGDFDGDGDLDFAFFRNESDNTDLDQYHLYLGNGDGTFQPETPLADDPGEFGYFNWSSTNAFATDYNNDGWLDIIYGGKLTSNSNSGAVLAMINDCPDVYAPGTACSRAPKFSRSIILQDLSFGSLGANALTYGDFTGDGIKDLMVGSPTKCNSDDPVRLYPGVDGGGLQETYEAVPGIGAATVMLQADFSLDGKIDFIYGTDDWNCGSHLGGQAFYYLNDGTSAPFASGVTRQLSSHQSHSGGNLYDFDLGVTLDYDNDPDNTVDFLIADGNNSGTFFLFANRTETTFVDCGDVESGVLDLGALAEAEMTITTARLEPLMNVPSGTTVTFYASNEDPANWQAMSPCSDDPAAYCVSFPKPIGRTLRWKATMCSDADTRRETPTIAGVEIKYDYNVAQEFVRSGVVVHDGVAYVGSIRQPGNRGKFYAANAALDQIYWEAGALLDATDDADRNIYTATKNGGRQLSFSVDDAGDARLQNAMQVASEEQARNVIEWARSARFGVDGGQTTRLGGIETSTPAVIGAPPEPLWYNYADATTRAAVDKFRQRYATRPTMVLFTARDGMLHAVKNDPTNISAPDNGKELWAFIPAKVVSAFVADRPDNAARSYPDGSPTVADVRFSDGAFRTVALIGGGNGSKSLFALDVTDTVDPETGEVSGPTPLWHETPGGNNAGQSYSTPVIGRVQIDGVERHIAIMATGVGFDDPNPPKGRGRDVYAVDLETGDRLWRFKARCSVTSDILLYETDDELEPGQPQIDGFIDRAVFADYCGYVYKVDPAVDLSADKQRDWNPGIGPIGIVNLNGRGTVKTDPAGNEMKALFWIGPDAGTAGALGELRPIAGTIAARADSSKRLVLFFGTGGLENYDPTLINEFYAVYADTGEIRSKLTGTCNLEGRCEKFYGGAAVTSNQVIVARSIDPPVGTDTCDFGSSAVQALKLDPDEDGDFVIDFSQELGAVVISSLFTNRGAVYAASLRGNLLRVGTPASPDAGGDSAGGGLGRGDTGDGDGGDGAGRGAMSIVGWRQVQ